MGQCGSQGKVGRGDQGQGLQDRDISATPVAWYLVSYPQHPRDAAVLATYRDPGHRLGVRFEAADTDPAHPLLTPFAGRRLASRRGGVIA